jgi:hypothetical protein
LACPADVLRLRKYRTALRGCVDCGCFDVSGTCLGCAGNWRKKNGMNRSCIEGATDCRLARIVSSYLVKGGVLACPADVLRLSKCRPALRGCVAGWLWLF